MRCSFRCRNLNHAHGSRIRSGFQLKIRSSFPGKLLFCPTPFYLPSLYAQLSSYRSIRRYQDNPGSAFIIKIVADNIRSVSVTQDLRPHWACPPLSPSCKPIGMNLLHQLNCPDGGILRPAHPSCTACPIKPPLNLSMASVVHPPHKLEYSLSPFHFFDVLDATKRRCAFV